MIGEAGLTHALYQVGYSITEIEPDYVVLGDTPSYDYAKIVQAVHLVLGGAGPGARRKGQRATDKEQ